jgi:hypothetical protein
MQSDKVGWSGVCWSGLSRLELATPDNPQTTTLASGPVTGPIASYRV